MEPDNPVLDDFVLGLAARARAADPLPADRVRRPGGADRRLRRPLRASAPARPRTCRCSACTARSGRCATIVLAQDVIYVGGGSMRNLLAIWRAHGLDDPATEAWERGIVLAGLSAGAMCWFEGGITRSSGPPETIAGLGLLAGLAERARRRRARAAARRTSTAVRSGALPGGWAADDGVGLLFEDERAGARGLLAAGRGGAARRRGRGRARARADRARAARRRPGTACRRPATPSRSCARCGGSAAASASKGSGTCRAIRGKAAGELCPDSPAATLSRSRVLGPIPDRAVPKRIAHRTGCRARRPARMAAGTKIRRGSPTGRRTGPPDR